MSHSLSTLGAEATIIMGQSPPGESYNRNRKGAPLLNGPSEFGSVCPIEVQWTTSPTKLCQPGDVLFCVRGATAGRLNTADKEYCIGRGLAAIRGRTGKFDNGFLRYVLDNGYARFQSRGVGSTFINISADELARFPVPIFPLPEQRRIAAILDKADELRAKRRAALVKLDTLTESIFLDMFGDPATNPKGFPTSTIDGIAEQVTDGEHLTPARTTEGIKLLSARNVRDGYIDFENVDYIGIDEYERIRRRCNPSVGDILISCSGTIGRVASVETDERFSLVRSAALVRPKSATIRTKFLEHYLRTPALKARMLRRANASSQANLFQGQIRELPVYVPPTELQDAFVRTIARVAALKVNGQGGFAELDGLFASIQHRAFRGEL